MISIVFKDFVLDDAPMERFVFSGGGNRIELSVDDDNGRRHSFRFEGVSAFKYHPSDCFDRDPFYVGGIYRKTILLLKESEWVVELNRRESEQLEPVSNNLNHYLMPSDEGVYELLARSIAKVESDE